MYWSNRGVLLDCSSLSGSGNITTWYILCNMAFACVVVSNHKGITFLLIPLSHLILLPTLLILKPESDLKLWGFPHTVSTLDAYLVNIWFQLYLCSCLLSGYLSLYKFKLLSLADFWGLLKTIRPHPLLQIKLVTHWASNLFLKLQIHEIYPYFP